VKAESKIDNTSAEDRKEWKVRPLIIVVFAFIAIFSVYDGPAGFWPGHLSSGGKWGSLPAMGGIVALFITLGLWNPIISKFKPSLHFSGWDIALLYTMLSAVGALAGSKIYLIKFL
jgi:hypothetical protein